MDYPPPIITLDDSRTKLILNQRSYANHIGDFDKVSEIIIRCFLIIEYIDERIS